jgi:hypothetical protein
MPEPTDLLDRLAELARQAEPPACEPRRADRAVRLAVITAARRRARRRVVGAVGAVLVAAAAGLVVAWITVPRPRPALTAPLRLDLPTGDRLVGAPGTRFRIDAAAPVARRVALTEGAMLFDVAHLRAGESFAVVTAEARLEVRGTVFTVVAAPGRTTVRVFEGQVRIGEGSGGRLLGAGEAWDSSGAPPRDAPLRAEAEEAVRRRQALAALPPAPDVAPPEPAAPAPAAPTLEPAVPTPQPATPTPTSPTPAIAAEAKIAPLADEAQIEGWIAAGELERALAAARAAAAASRDPGRFLVLEADALRGLGRSAEAARAYDDAAGRLPAEAAAQAAYQAAALRLKLGDADGALASLDAGRADAPGTALEERALALRVRALVAAGRADDARALAGRYLERFPEGAMGPWMRQLRRAADAAP